MTADGTLKEHIQYHRDGSVWAKGQTLDGVAVGYWEWFRVSGTKMRSGSFENGKQTGEWITYDKSGMVYKVTNIKPKKKIAGYTELSTVSS
jgi:antitoxin component YwqK of YwqJK toxin-antitoxin module